MKKDFPNEFLYQTSRSSGPGGQNVNKVNTKVELRFNISESQFLSEDEKKLLFEKLPTRINNEGVLILVSQSERTQLKNKEKVTERFYQLLETALKPKKKRKPTKPSKASIEKRLKLKKIKSEKKATRKNDY